MSRKKSDAVQVKLRISREMHRKLEQSMRRRSTATLNGEIVQRLEQSFVDDRQTALMEASADLMTERVLTLRAEIKAEMQAQEARLAAMFPGLDKRSVAPGTIRNRDDGEQA